MKKANNQNKIRYGVVGLGHIAQTAVLPAFKNAKANSELTALISTDPVKLDLLAKKYNVPSTYHTEEIDDCLESGEIDALYIATPNTNHLLYAEKAANAGVHVLCEKPLAPTVIECKQIINIAEANAVKLMVAYRLHFDPANLEAISIAQTKLGDVRSFSSVFTLNVTDRDNIRLKSAKGGGPLRDIGIYCINAARYIFQNEPFEVTALSASRQDDSRFDEVPETIGVVMKFPDERLATFTVGFGSSENSWFEVVGSDGSLCLDNAYDYESEAKLQIYIDKWTKTKRFAKHDQFGPELIYFSKCLLNNEQPEPSAEEGLADVAVIEAIEESFHTGRAVEIELPLQKKQRPSLKQKIFRPAVRAPISTIHVKAPSDKH